MPRNILKQTPQVNYSFRKSLVLSLIGLAVILGTVSLIIDEVRKGESTSESPEVAAIRTSGLNLGSIAYPGISWSKPSPYKVAVLLNAGTDSQTLATADGVKISGATLNNVSDNLFIYYDKVLTNLGYAKIKVLGEPSQQSFWVSQYLKGREFIEIQHTPVFAKRGTKPAKYFVLIFYGTYPRI